MIVVSTPSLIALSRIGRLNLLASFYRRILIPAEVQYEVTVAGRGLPGAEEVRNAHWIEVAPQKSPPALRWCKACQSVGEGERGAVLLAKSLDVKVRIFAFDRFTGWWARLLPGVTWDRSPDSRSGTARRHQ